MPRGKTVCLNMIVKDESHVIKDTLEKLITHITFDYWVICDTGSTDGTQDIIKNFFKELNIPGELFQHVWQDFGHNRTLALQEAYRKADYIFIFDADDTIHGTMVFPNKLDKDFYKFKFGSGFTYVRPLLVTGYKKTRFVGVLHEYLSCDEGQPSEGMIEGDYYVNSGKTGSRSRDKDKYLKDALILKEAYAKELEKPNKGLSGRYAFYCAQSFKDANKTDDSIEWYTLVADTLNTWVQEKYYSCLMAGFQYRGQKNFQKAMEYFLKAEKYDSDRSEGIFFAAEMLKDSGLHTLSVMLYEKYKSYNKDPKDKLFLFRDFYNDFFEFNTSISAFETKNNSLAYSCIKKMILNNIAAHHILDRAIRNLRFCFSELVSDPDTLDLFYRITDYIQTCNDPKEIIVMWNALFKKHRLVLGALPKKKLQPEGNKVFMSITSCKRLDLFQETVNSMLNHWMDIDEVDYWFCVDDNSSKEDRLKMRKMYPWIKFYMKTPQEKGHRESMNIIWNKLNELKPKYWIHMEDDFLFHVKRSYVSDSIAFLDKQTDIKQVLFNREYAETIDQVTMKACIPLEPGFVLHEYKLGDFQYPNCHYWPHYSFRPSMCSVETILGLGNYDSPNTFFEMDYATKWTDKGYKSAFFDMVCCRHTGRLTSERNDKSIKNAYSLNNESQFSKISQLKIINLKRRPDRKEATINLLKNIGISDYEFVEAIDGKTLAPTPELKTLFAGNDFGTRVGVVGCALSHYNLWKALLADESNDYYVIFEDDITFASNFKDKFEELKNNNVFADFEYLFLGYHMFAANREATKDVYVTESNNIKVCDMQNNLNIGAGFAYSINKKGAQILVDYIAANGIKHGIDYVVKICKELKCCEVRPQLVFSEWYEVPDKNVDTDIQKENNTLNFEVLDEEYTFIQGLDMIGSDLFYDRKSIDECKILASLDSRCAGFNSLGFFKTEIDKDKLQPSQYFGESDGIYIKNKFLTPVSKKTTVKLIGNWGPSTAITKEFGLMPTGDLELSCKDEADYYVIINSPSNEEFYDPKKTIVFQMEPWVYDETKHWGVKTWGDWANPNPSKFMHVHSHKKYLNGVQWTLQGDLDNFPAKQDTTAIILSSKLNDVGHIKRTELVRGMSVDVYGKENYHNILSYVGPVPDENRYNVYSKYKYAIAVENNSELNYATEKIWEPLICECLPFYWGCPNLEEYIDPQSFVRLPEDPIKATEIIQQAIKEDWWSQRIDKIREAKKKIMTELGFFSTIKKIISENKMLSVFTRVYENCEWGTNDNPKYNGSSGCGSKIEANINTYIPFLKTFITKNNIKSVTDLGCGDFLCGPLIYTDLLVEYHGYDAYNKLILSNQSNYSSDKIKFTHLDFCNKKEELVSTDLLILKDVLQHWELPEIYKFMDYIVGCKKFKIILICNCGTQTTDNTDITTGDWRALSADFLPLKKYLPIKIYQYDTKEVSIIKLE